MFRQAPSASETTISGLRRGSSWYDKEQVLISKPAMGDDEQTLSKEMYAQIICCCVSDTNEIREQPEWLVLAGYPRESLNTCQTALRLVRARFD